MMHVVCERGEGLRMLARSPPWRTPRAIRAISAPLICSCRSSTAAYSSRRSARRNDANSRQVDTANGWCRQCRSATGTTRRMPGWSSTNGTNPVSATQSIARSGRCARTSATSVSAWTMSPSDEGRTTRIAFMCAPCALRAVPPSGRDRAWGGPARSHGDPHVPVVQPMLRRNPVECAHVEPEAG